MNLFDKYLLKRDKILERRIEIDNSLYEKLSELSKVYEASINKLVNIAIIGLIENENIQIYKRPDNEISESHNFSIRETSYRKLEELKAKYGISIFKLTNIAIYNAIKSIEEEN